MPVSILRSSFPGWAETAEVYVPLSEPFPVGFDLNIPEGTKFFVACTSPASGLSIPGEGPLRINDLGEMAVDNQNRFVDPQRGLIVALDPPPGLETVQLHGNPNFPQQRLIYATAFVGATRPPTKGCKVCKITAKAIAAAIVTFGAATAAPIITPLIPAALVHMVASFSAVSSQQRVLLSIR
jgi:hypothetical protein